MPAITPAPIPNQNPVPFFIFSHSFIGLTVVLTETPEKNKEEFGLPNSAVLYIIES